MIQIQTFLTRSASSSQSMVSSLMFLYRIFNFHKCISCSNLLARFMQINCSWFPFG
ncbi:hypothetical protein F383_19849 [Gossypium arboreum]|uniref:Uncharacterized protein n=1 Tax=Gossypium arboreum TaxID=29729 RepID=A0A0B0MI09_GOSAR|nr:hypothetical protein F383_19849 [Gossypium arboreum]